MALTFDVELENPDPCFKKTPSKVVKVVCFRTLGISLTSMFVAVATAFLIFKYSPYYINLVYYPIAAMFALAKTGQEKDIQQRLYSLPAWIFFPSVIVFVLYGILVVHHYFSPSSSLPLSLPLSFLVS